MNINILGWENWDVTKGREKGPDYRFEAEYQERPDVCPRCGTESPSVESKGIQEVHVRDLKIHGKRVGIDVRKRRWLCKECRKTFTEQPPEIDPRRRMTTRLVEALERESFRQPFTALADEYGVGEGTVREIFNEKARELEVNREVEPPEVLGIDEVHISGRRFVAANLGVEPSALVDILEDRSQTTVERFLSTEGWRDRVRVVAMDMWNPYRTALEVALPDAVIVVDKFHLLQIANRAVDRLRDSVARDASREELETLRSSRTILRRRRHDLEEEERERLELWRTTHPNLVEAFELKEKLHGLYKARDMKEGEERLEAWLASVKGEMADVFDEQIRALKNWRKEILAYFTTEITNAATEQLNRFIRLTHELGNGYSFETLRAKMLFGTPSVKGAYWGGDGAATKVPGSLGYSLGVGGGSGPSAGANLEWLASRMESRSSEWSDPAIWQRD